MRPAKIISGGQTGADRGALEAAVALGINHGGWCPRGRVAEDGCVPAAFQLQETDAEDYAVRTQWNVRDADATLIVCRGPLGGGTELTRRVATQLGKPCLIVDLAQRVDFPAVRAWLAANAAGVLNVAGPRESQRPGIQSGTRQLLMELFDE